MLEYHKYEKLAIPSWAVSRAAWSYLRCGPHPSAGSAEHLSSSSADPEGLRAAVQAAVVSTMRIGRQWGCPNQCHR